MDVQSPLQESTVSTGRQYTLGEMGSTQNNWGQAHCLFLWLMLPSPFCFLSQLPSKYVIVGIIIHPPFIYLKVALLLMPPEGILESSKVLDVFCPGRLD